MAHFYGIVQGPKGEASRMATKNEFIRTTAASYSGAVHVSASVKDGQDWVKVWMTKWPDNHTGEVVLYDGPLRHEYIEKGGV